MGRPAATDTTDTTDTTATTATSAVFKCLAAQCKVSGFHHPTTYVRLCVV